MLPVMMRSAGFRGNAPQEPAIRIGRLCSHATFLVGLAVAFGSQIALAEPQQPSARTASTASAATVIGQVKVRRAGEQLNVRVEGNGLLTYQAERLSDPDRLVLDFSGTRVASSQAPIPSALKPVLRVRVGQYKPDVTRVVIELDRFVPYSVIVEGTTLTVAFAAPSAAATSNSVASHRSPGSAPPRSRLRETPQPPPAPRAGVDTSRTPRSEPMLQPAVALATPATPAPPVVKAEPLEIAFRHGLLTVHAQNQTLRAVLEGIGAESGLSIMLAQGLGDERVSVNFNQSRLEEALREVLKDYDAFFFYGVEKKQDPASLKAVWVYPASRGQGFKPLPPDAWASTQEVEQMLSDPDPDVRARAIEAVIKRKGPRAESAVLDALKDDNDMVRTKALHEALESDVELSQNTLINLALYDRSEDVRILALQALPVDPSLRWVVEHARQDLNSQVSDTARKILKQLDKPNARGSSYRIN